MGGDMMIDGDIDGSRLGTLGIIGGGGRGTLLLDTKLTKKKACGTSFVRRKL
jgi:hypothetical protein